MKTLKFLFLVLLIFTSNNILAQLTADIVDVTPDPRNTNAGNVTVTFSAPVTGVDKSDFTLTRNGSSVNIASLSVSGSGDTYTLDLSGFTELAGNYILTLVALGSDIVDGSSNTLSGDASDTWVMDLTAPAAPSGLFITDDYGSSSSDGITFDQNIYIGGIAEANSTVEVFIDGVSIGSTPANASGVWSFDYTGTALVAGGYAITAKATDMSGNTGLASSVFNITIDTDLPSAPVITGIRNDSGTNTTDGKTNDQSIFIDGTAEANSSVEVFIDGVSKGSINADGGGVWAFDNTLSDLTSGSHSITAKTTDLAGNTGLESVPFVVTIDIIAPNAPVISGIINDSGVNGADGITNDATIVVEGTAEANSNVEIFFGGISKGTTNTDAFGDWSFDYTGTTLTEGAHVITAKAKDDVGNISSASLPYNITIDTSTPSAPVVTGIRDDNGTFSTDEITNDPTIYIDGTAEANSSVEVFIDGISKGSITANVSGDWTFNYTGTSLAEGSFVITAKTTDIAGNTSVISSALNVTIDLTLPAVPSVTDISGTYNVDKSFSITGEADASFKYSLNNGSTWNNYSGTVTLTAQGTYDIIAYQIDLAGNASPNSSLMSVIIDKTTQAPTLTTPASNSASASEVVVRFSIPENALSESVKLTFKCTGLPSGYSSIADRIITFKPNCETSGSKIVRLNGLNLASNTDSVLSVYTSGSDGAKLFDGATYEVKLEYQDFLGNTVSSVTNTNFFYEQNPPAADVVDVADPRNTHAGIVTINFDRGVRVSTVGITDFTLTRDGVTVSLASTSVAYVDEYWSYGYLVSKKFTVDLTDETASPGTYIFTIKGGVTSGIVTSGGSLFINDASDSWVNDQTQPTADIMDISPDPRNNAVAVVAVNFSKNVTGVDISDFSLTRDASPVSLTGISVSGSDANYSLDLTTVTGSSGTYVLTVNGGAGIKDLAGNNLASSASDTWVTDATPPNLTSISIQSNNTNNNAFAKVDDIVTLSFTANENIQDVVVLINGVAATTISGGPINWIASREMKNTDSEGVVTFSIDYEDAVSNSGVTKTEITTGLNVEFLKNAPTLNSVSIISNNTYNNRAKVGNVVTLSFSSATKLSNVSVNLANHSVAATTSNDKDWTAVWTMVEGDSEGFVPFTINFTDKPGNAGNQVITTTNSSKVKFDKTKPELNAVNITSNNTYPQWVGVGGVVTVSLTSSENIILSNVSIEGSPATIAGSGKNWTASYTMKSSDIDGNVDFEIITFADSSGNAGSLVNATTNSSSVLFDKTAPSLTSVSIVSDNLETTRARTGDLVKILFTADDSIVNVIAKVNTKNAIVTPKGLNSWEAEFPISSSISDGKLNFSINYKDLAGNNTETTATTDGSKVVVDNTPPAFSTVSIASNNANPALAIAGNVVTISFETSENIKTPIVTINNIAATSITGSLKSWIATRTMNPGEPQGVIPFSIIIQDSTGNSPAIRYSTSDASTVSFDDSSPIISSITVPAGIYKVGSIIPVTLITDGSLYSGTTVEVNGKSQILVNNANNTYSVNYTVQENDIERNSIAALPVNIVLTDAAGLSTSRSLANVTLGVLTIDSRTPKIDAFSSNAETVGIARIGQDIIFTLKTLVAEPGLIVSPTTYNGKALTWTTTDGGATYTSKYTVVEGDPQQIVPLQLGNITLSDMAGNNDVKLLADYNPIQKQIFTTKPTIQITGSKVKCFDNVNENVTFNFTGVQPFKLWYTHSGNKFFIDEISSANYTIQIKEGTVSLDSLLDATTNRIYSAPTNVTITVNPLPVVTLDITGSPYSPDSPKDELNKYVQPVDKRSGVFSGEGVGYLSGKYYFYPTIIPEESKDKNLEIIYSFTDALGCVGRDTSYVFVSSTPVNIPDLKTGYCNYSDPVTVSGVLPSGHTGIFELFDSNNILLSSGWLQIDSVTMQINPQLLPVGTYRVNYRALKYPSLELTSFINKTFTVEAKRTGISITGLNNEYCFNSQGSDIEVVVTGVSFENGDKGHFTGSPVFAITPNAHTAKFKYSTALAEQDYNISYVYESVNGCLSDPVSRTIHINPLPELIFTLNDNYNFNQATIPLVGNRTSTSYLFSGEGVSRDTLFTSAARVGAPIIITYSFTDDKGCSSQTQRTTTIYKATETINNLSSVYCYEDRYFDISCAPNISDTITGTFISRRNALEITGKNTARYFLSRVGNGVDTVFFNYKIKGTDYSIFKEVLVDSIGQVQIISNLESYDFCKSIAKVQFNGVQIHPYGGQGNFNYSGNSSALLNRGSSAELYPPLETPGTYLVNYTYTSKSGCTSTDIKNLNIYSVPSASFNIMATCPGIIDSVDFVNTSNPIDETMRWTWKVEGLEFTKKDLKYKFQLIGSKPITLIAKSSNGCESSKDTTINIGISPQADFDWSHDCNIGSPIIFTDKSTNATSPTYTWKMNETTSLGSGSTIQHNFNEIGVYDIELLINTLDGCADSITKRLMLQPYIKIVDLADSHYLENFDSNNPYYNWEAKGISMSDSCRWNLGAPNGSVINYPASGLNSWYTRITDKTNVENSQVISPCFDLSGLKNPMIKLNIWSSSEYKRDGAVLQYSTNQGKTWTNLGSKGEGIGWFDSENIQSQPGGEKQFYGWNENPMNEWNTARHSLDNLIGITNVRFRIAYAADGGGISKVDGFAFDDVWIGDRTQNVIYEYFVNTNIADAQSYYLQTRELEEDLIEDIIPIHYHTSYPSGDPFNQFYTSGPSSRVYFYGVSQIPYAQVNGNNSFGFPAGLNALTYFKSISDNINIKSLSDPKVDMTISAVKNANTCNIAVSLKHNIDLTGKMLGLQCAVVKNSLSVSGKVYHNILRSFIPDASGTAITGNLSAGESQSINLSWTPSNSDEFANAKIIAFVQDLNTKEIYQAATFDLSLITSTNPIDISEIVNVFPNPVSDLLLVVSEIDINEIQIFDISGRLVRKYSKLGSNISIPVNDLVGGVYLLKGNTLKGTFVKKFVKQ